MVKENSLEILHAAQIPLADLIFLHGLTGDPKETWRNEESFWPDWLAEDFKHLNIYTAGYPASIFAQWAKKEMDLFERASNLLEHMAGLGLGKRPIIFVVHSLGGLIVKQILRRANDSGDEDYRRIGDSTRLVIFLSTPHTGASLASVLKLIPGVSPHIELLANGTGFLDDLNQFYRNYTSHRSDLKTVVYYEKFKTLKADIVVTRESADPGVAKTEPVALDKDHINICKPSSREDVVYLGVRRHIDNLYHTLVAHLPDEDDYTNRSGSDRRDLLQKLIDAGREHEYSYANDAQSRYARKIQKTGLFTSARNDHDLLLSELESRFIFHIYHPLICKGIDHLTITHEIQSKVIDPLANKVTGSTYFSMKDVLSALYYLTEQCHISWDAAQ